VTAVLELADVTFRRDGKQIIDGISLTVQEGEHWALLGPNGAGKSTLLGFCAAVTFPTSGTVTILGEQMGRVDLARLRHSIGHVNPRHRLQYALTVREVVLTGITATIDIPNRWTPTDGELRRADAMIKTVGLSHRADNVWPTLSQGERGRTLIARALISIRGCCCSTNPPQVSTWRRASSCWRPSTRSTRPIRRWPRSW
jgi:iron complex transport system ATP-binding protein